MIISRDKSLLFLPFAAIVTEFERRLKAAGFPFYLYMGLRDWQTQDELYAQGRTKPGKIVTNARGGDSLHNYGLAVDFVADGQTEKPGMQWSWDTSIDSDADGHSDWMQIGEIGEECGLEWGGRWLRFPDLPHFQKTYGLKLTEMKELYRIGGIKKVWEACQ